jgi:hypothetical protein
MKRKMHTGGPADKKEVKEPGKSVHKRIPGKKTEPDVRPPKKSAASRKLEGRQL